LLLRCCKCVSLGKFFIAVNDMGGVLAIDLGPIYTSESSCIYVQISDFAKKQMS